ncbi:hypothetical protein C2G38_2031336 [Gigaspora rosea]|uniref:Peptidase S1 domain-containing protein n=1 Tax=Gigaspora rosea TaxID=44941 RepID=A0A397VT75_9GLOM|nr:hypothetical protein C2G38_2031336 [Gigaspora rosea]
MALNSTAVLNSGLDDMLELAQHYRPVECLIYIDVKINNIIIATCDEDRNDNAAFLNAAKIYYPIYMYYNCIRETNNNTISQNNMKLESRNDIVNYILAGDGLSVERFNITPNKCSAGFWAKSLFNPINYIVTAGHCHREGASYYLLPWNSTHENDKYYVGKMFDYRLSPIDSGGPVFSYNHQDRMHTSINGILLGGFDYDINGDINNAIIQVTPIDFIFDNYPGIEMVTVT